MASRVGTTVTNLTNGACRLRIAEKRSIAIAGLLKTEKWLVVFAAETEEYVDRGLSKYVG